jgi:ankyrin repeat protein
MDVDTDSTAVSVSAVPPAVPPPAAAPETLEEHEKRLLLEMSDDLRDMWFDLKAKNEDEFPNGGGNVAVDEATGNTILHEAVRLRDMAAIEFFTRRQFPNMQNVFATTLRNKRGETPMYMAADAGLLEAIRLLEVYDITTESSVTHLSPLEVAIVNNHTECVKMLSDFGTDVNRKDPVTGSTPLTLAALGGNVDIVNLMLEGGVHVDPKGIHDYTPIEAALRGANPASVIPIFNEIGPHLDAVTPEVMELIVAKGYKDAFEAAKVSLAQQVADWVAANPA